MALLIFPPTQNTRKASVNNRKVLVDTGPLVALLVAEDRHHSWIRERLQECPSPLMTCEPVLTEAFFVLKRGRGGVARFFDLLRSGLLSVEFDLMAERSAIESMVVKYHNVPMSLADACLVRMAELMPASAILTLDGDFRLYRKHEKHSISVILPPGA